MSTSEAIIGSDAIDLTEVRAALARPDLPRRERNDLLSCLPRIRRGGDLPNAILREQRYERRYPYRFFPEGKGSSLHLRYRRSGWQGAWEGDSSVRMRQAFCWIYDGEQRIGALEFWEYDADIDVFNGEFFAAMDSVSAINGELAEVVSAEWEDISTDLLAYGPILEFLTAWMTPDYAQDGRWAAIAEKLIKERFSRHSILIMKAFPLEYEGRAPDDSPAHAACVRRQKAMIRYYRRLFGVRPLTSYADEEDWLWRPNADVADAILPPECELDLD